MALPINLVLVRHGQSEGNIAKRHLEKGDPSLTNLLRSRHTANYRLTKLGRQQAKKAGVWLRIEFPKGFDRYVTSQYVRAMETASLLNIPGAEWRCDFNLTERDWGSIDSWSEEERQAKFEEEMKRRNAEPFFWRPPNGESFAQLCLRLNRPINTLHRESSDKNVCITCHGEVIRGFQVSLEWLLPSQFKKIIFSNKPQDRMHNCQIVHYTRRNPVTNELSEHADWVRMIRPTEDPVWISPWRKVTRPRYTNKQLLKIVSDTPRLIP